MTENAKKLIAALRSGEYKRGTGRLCSITEGERRYCCLGVATSLYLKEHPGSLSVTNELGLRKYDGEAWYLIEPVREWLGFSNTRGGTASGQSLAHRNDEGASFEEIADFIESEPEGLFIA